MRKTCLRHNIDHGDVATTRRNFNIAKPAAKLVCNYRHELASLIYSCSLTARCSFSGRKLSLETQFVCLLFLHNRPLLRPTQHFSFRGIKHAASNFARRGHRRIFSERDFLNKISKYIWRFILKHKHGKFRRIWILRESFDAHLDINKSLFANY